MGAPILLFSPEFPCWDEETVRLAGDDPSSLVEMLEAGELAQRGGGYVLTSKGETMRRELAQSIYVPVADMGAPIDDERQVERALEHNRMCLLLDRAFKQQWGVKEISYSEKFPVTPALADNEYFAFDAAGRACAIWPQHPLVMSFLETFPYWGVAARSFPARGQAGIDAWAKRAGARTAALQFDFVLRSHADFEHYRSFPPLRSDRFGFYNVDVMFALRCGEDPHELLPVIGALHIFLMEQRRVYVPGWYDLDVDEQEDWTLLTLVTDSEAQLSDLTATLRDWGKALIEAACPLYLLGTSIERLRMQKEPKDTIYDWFQEETVRILRPEEDDGTNLPEET